MLNGMMGILMLMGGEYHLIVSYENEKLFALPFVGLVYLYQFQFYES